MIKIHKNGIQIYRTEEMKTPAFLLREISEKGNIAGKRQEREHCNNINTNNKNVLLRRNCNIGTARTDFAAGKYSLKKTSERRGKKKHRDPTANDRLLLLLLL
jgi:hypothetical protein